MAVESSRHIEHGEVNGIIARLHHGCRCAVSAGAHGTAARTRKSVIRHLIASRDVVEELYPCHYHEDLEASCSKLAGDRNKLCLARHGVRHLSPIDSTPRDRFRLIRIGLSY